MGGITWPTGECGKGEQQVDELNVEGQVLEWWRITGHADVKGEDRAHKLWEEGVCKGLVWRPKRRQ